MYTMYCNSVIVMCDFPKYSILIKVITKIKASIASLLKNKNQIEKLTSSQNFEKSILKSLLFLSFNQFN